MKLIKAFFKGFFDFFGIMLIVGLFFLVTFGFSWGLILLGVNKLIAVWISAIFTMAIGFGLQEVYNRIKYPILYDTK